MGLQKFEMRRQLFPGILVAAVVYTYDSIAVMRIRSPLWEMLLNRVLAALLLSATSLQIRGAVSSSNVVGYIKLVVPPGYSLISNQLDDGRVNSISEIISPPFDGFAAADLDGTNWITSTFSSPTWSVPDLVFAPGGGARLFNPGTQEVSLTFVGGLPAGTLKNFIPAGRSIRSSLFPDAGGITSLLRFPLVAGVKLSTINTNGDETLLASCDGSTWSPKEPFIYVAQAVIVDSPRDFIWQGNYSGSPTNNSIIISQSPQKVLVHEGESFSLSVRASANLPLRYQWQRNGDGIRSANAPDYNVASAATSDTGQYWGVVSTSNSRAWTDLASVEVVPAGIPILNIKPGSDGQLTLRATASPGGTFSFEASQDLLSWSTFAAQTNATGIVEISIPAAEAHQMFRAVRN
jgi:hypothetical protein